MNENNIFLIDTNILVYNYDSSEAAKHAVAKSIIDKCWGNKTKLAISSQNLSEFFSVVTSKKILSKKDALSNIVDITRFSGFIKINFDHETVIQSAKISDEHGMSYWDSLLAATMKQSSILNLYTENVKDFKVPWLNAVNPFEAHKKRQTKNNLKKDTGL